MKATRSIAWSLRLTVLAVMLVLPASLFAANRAKKTAAKEPPSKIQLMDDKNAAKKLAGREGECAPIDILSM